MRPPDVMICLPFITRPVCCQDILLSHAVDDKDCDLRGNGPVTLTVKQIGGD